MSVLKLANVKKIYGTGSIQTVALKGVNLEVKRKEFISIIGPSGSGKSTLLHIMGLLDRPTEGEVLFEKEPVHTLTDDQLSYIRNKKIGFVFQAFNLIPSLTMFENIELPLIISGMDADKRKKIVEDIMKKLEIYNRADHKPNQVSGGERQRAAIGRALANDPDIILADEPTGNLDTRRGEEVMEIFKQLNKEGRTIVVITHDPEIAKYTRRVIHIRDGKIEKRR